MRTTITNLEARIIESFNTLDAFAAAIGWTPRKVADIATGKKEPSAREIEHLASTLHIESPSELHSLFFDETQKVSAEAEKKRPGRKNSTCYDRKTTAKRIQETANESTAQADEMKRLIGLLMDQITDERKLRELYLFMNRLVCR